MPNASDQKSNAYLETEPVGSLMRRYAVPCIISLLVAALYNIVDQIFIANATYLGSYGNAANTVVFPLTVVALAVAVMIGDGCCAFVSIALGASRKEDAHRSIGSSVLLVVGASVLLTALYLIFSEPILSAFGGKVNEETYACAREYFFWITLGLPFYMFGQAMNPIIRSDGSPRFAMVATVSGAVINIILDPIFIFPLHMGMMGAAVATVLGQILTAGMSAWYLMHMKAVKLCRGSFHLHASLMRQYLPLGITSFLSQISLVMAMAAINNMIRRYGALDPIFGQAQYAQIPMAVVGIVMKVFQIVISISVGMAAGCIPVVGYNIGAGRKDRAKSLFTLLLKSEAILGLAALVIVEVFPRQLIGIFGAGNESTYYTDFAIRSFRIYLCMMPLATVNKGTFIYLQSLGKAMASTAISMIREIVFGVGFALLLPRFFGLDGVLYSMPVSDVLTFAIAAVVVVRTYRELGRTEERDALAQKAEGQSAAAPSAAAQTGCIVTIGRSYGAGGRSIGKLVAEELHIPYYDAELLEKAAQSHGLSEKVLRNMDEKPLHSAMIYRSVGLGTPGYDDLATLATRSQVEVIECVAEEGPCVIVGRLADQVLRGRYDLLSVFITASEESRIQHVMQREGLSHEEAARQMRKVEKERAAFYNQRSATRWGAAEGYDLCVNTDWYGPEKAAHLIASLAREQTPTAGKTK